MTVSLHLARELLDMGARLRAPGTTVTEPPQAAEQLRGAVAIHNILQREGVAYLADEVGMGKTYVALGAIALFRHFQPSFRVAVIAPRENIQQKWMKEWFNFATHIVRVPDLRMKAFHGGPARALVRCDSLRQFVRETTVNAEREFFLRLSSFSLGTGDDEADLRGLRDRFQRDLPWVADAIPSLHSKKDFKDGLAKALCCAIPAFDLLVIDEGHNLKHGFSERIAARNRVLAFLFGRPSPEVDRRLFPDYGPRARKVLFLSATPIEDDYRQLWNQLDVVGKGAPFAGLADPEASEAAKRELARRFVIRRVTSLTVGETRLTKNLYRREWRRGGLAEHDTAQKVDDVRQRLAVALVQKKVAELLNSPKFNASFQMGMLASFESFLETTKVKKADQDLGTFDDAEQTEDVDERQGIDVGEVNRLAADYRRQFGAELPHPKMDALVARLSDSWRTGRKALVFLRRVASVWEIKERLDVAYNQWLFKRLDSAFQGLPAVAADFAKLKARYLEERAANRRALMAARTSGGKVGEEEQDRGGLDTFFAWFFRGDGPDGPWLSGAAFSKRFIQARYELSTFFEDNHVADLLGVNAEGTFEALASAIGCTPEVLSAKLANTAAWYLTSAKRPGRREIFEAAQGGATELLKDGAVAPGVRRAADLEWQMLWMQRRQPRASHSAEFDRALNYETFFSELRRPEWQPLRDALWPAATGDDEAEAIRNRELRRELLGTASRLGHSLIDLYTQAIRERGSMRVRPRGGASAPEVEADGAERSGEDASLIRRYLELLESQRTARANGRDWSSFDELSELSSHFALILDVNEPGVRSAPIRSAARTFGELLRQQQPVGGMAGGVNKTMVRQFRMPGYPFVMLSTDLLQEGEDLHTFCADVYHYGLAWTPSAIEQRIGRVDRVRSRTERAAAASTDDLAPEDKLQVFYPHLEDTVERLQVRRVLRRMQEFIRLMHEGLGGQLADASKLSVPQELAAPDLPEPISVPLETSFPVQERDVKGQRRVLAVDDRQARATAARLAACRRDLPGTEIAWEPQIDQHSIAGTALLADGRRQPFALHLQSRGDDLTARCVSPVGTVAGPEAFQAIEVASLRIEQQIGLIDTGEEGTSDATVEEEVLLGDPQHDIARVAWLVQRVTSAADRLENAVFPDADLQYGDVRESLHAEGRVADDAG